MLKKKNIKPIKLLNPCFNKPVSPLYPKPNIKKLKNITNKNGLTLTGILFSYPNTIESTIT